MRKKKDFDCVEFSHEMAAQAWKRSGAKTIEEYVAFVNANAKDSDFNKSYKERTESKSKIQQEC